MNKYELIEDDHHGLLEPPSPAYSNMTVRRAFIVWMYCGQKNKFRDVCNYYHHLETMEDKLPSHLRAVSRHHEFNLFTNPPPKSDYLKKTFPNLYTDKPLDKYHINKLEAIRNEKCVFKLEGFNEIYRKNGATTNEIVTTSQMIRNYCKTHMISLRSFLKDFQEYAIKCGLQDTVSNVAVYIKRKMIDAELQVLVNYPEEYSFLNTTPDCPLDRTVNKEVINGDKTIKDEIDGVAKVNGESKTNAEEVKVEEKTDIVIEDHNSKDVRNEFGLKTGRCGANFDIATVTDDKCEKVKGVNYNEVGTNDIAEFDTKQMLLLNSNRQKTSTPLLIIDRDQDVFKNNSCPFGDNASFEDDKDSECESEKDRESINGFSNNFCNSNEEAWKKF